MEIHIKKYKHLIKRILRIGHLSSMGMQEHIASSSLFSTDVTLLEMEEIGIPCTLLMFSVLLHAKQAPPHPAHELKGNKYFLITFT